MVSFNPWVVAGRGGPQAVGRVVGAQAVGRVMGGAGRASGCGAVVAGRGGAGPEAVGLVGGWAGRASGCGTCGGWAGRPSGCWVGGGWAGRASGCGAGGGRGGGARRAGRPFAESVRAADEREAEERAEDQAVARVRLGARHGRDRGQRLWEREAPELRR